MDGGSVTWARGGADNGEMEKETKVNSNNRRLNEIKFLWVSIIEYAD